MPRLIRLACGLAALALTAGPAAADAPAGEACANTLSPEARTIYGAAAPKLRSDTKIPDLLRATVRPMVISGKIDRAAARPQAEAAGKCLQALRR